MRRLKEKLVKKRGALILDIATGRGDNIPFLQSLVPGYRKIEGIDIAPAAVEQAASRFPDPTVRIVQADAHHLPYEDDSFDMAAIANSLHHLSSPAEALQEMRRVVKPGGWLIVDEMYRDGAQSEAQLTHVMIHHWWAEIDRKLGIIHNPTYTRREIQELMFDAGISIDEVSDLNLDTPPALPPDSVEKLVSMMDPYLQRIKGDPDYVKLEQQAHELKLRLRTAGYASAARLFVGSLKRVNFKLESA